MLLKTAKLLRACGISVVPTRKDKIPIVKWGRYQKELPDDTDLERWFTDTANSMALVAGTVQCIDFDERYSKGIFSRYAKRAEEVGLDQLLGQLILQETPSGGQHLVFQCQNPIGNTKLAEKINRETLIETRGDGGYFLIAPSEGYTLINGDWSSIPAINEEDRDALLNLARTFDERAPTEAHAEPHASGDTPGDDFDFRADMGALLKKHDWKPASRDAKYWTRPGKEKGISASWDVVPGRFFVFSSSTQFEVNHVYRPWHVYAILECGGDYARAAGELRRQGFGGAPPVKPVHSPQLPPDWHPQIEQAPKPVPADGIDPAGDAPTVETREEKLRRLWTARRFDPASKPAELRVRFSLAGVPISTPGNLTAITAQAKVGKSALLQGFVAATFTAPERDCLSVIGQNTAGHAVIYVDTEQSKDDFWRAIDRTKDRAGAVMYPAWLIPHCVSDLPVAEIRDGLAVKMADAQPEFGGIHSVFIDGVADMVLDVNDAEECNALVADLFRLATRYDCSVVVVIHKNPGSDKTRGHLGSQIERKAETNLTLDKEDDQTVVWSIKQRRAPIFKKDGPRFTWSDEAAMHVTVFDSGRPKISATLEKWCEHARTVFGKSPKMTYVELRAALIADAGSATSTAEKQIGHLRKSGVIKIDSFGNYSFNDLQK